MLKPTFGAVASCPKFIIYLDSDLIDQALFHLLCYIVPSHCLAGGEVDQKRPCCSLPLSGLPQVECLNTDQETCYGATSVVLNVPFNCQSVVLQWRHSQILQLGHCAGVTSKAIRRNLNVGLNQWYYVVHMKHIYLLNCTHEFEISNLPFQGQ